MPAPISWNHSPLPMNRFAPLPLGAVRPEGALKGALEAQRGGDEEERLCRAFLLENEAEQKTLLRDLTARLNGGAREMTPILRTLMRAYGAVNDAAIPQAVLRMLKDLAETTRETPFFGPEDTAAMADTTHAALWLYNLTGNRALLSLCALLRAQGPDWTSLLHTFPQTRPVAEIPPRENPAYFRAEGRTLAAALRACGLRALYEGGLKNETAFRAAWKKLMRYHGAAHGMFNADPLLAGANPARGVDSEAVLEMLRTLETLCWTLGAPECGEAMERIAFCALPAAYGTQRANQLAPGEDDPARGLAQVTAAQWMAAKDGLAAFGYGPCQVRWRVGEVPVRVEVEDGWPWTENVRMRVRLKNPAAFRLYLRIPAWTQNARVTVANEAQDAAPGGFHVLERTWQDGDEIALSLPAPVHAEKGYHQSLSVVRGAVAYALPLHDEARWNWALLEKRGFQPADGPEGPGVWAWLCPAAEWTDFDALPVLPHVAEERAERVRLVPYGQTRARVAQFPAGMTE